MKKTCSSCSQSEMFWDWDNGHHHRCKKYRKPIPTPDRFTYPLKIPGFCQDGYDERVCGNCGYWEHEEIDDGHVCVNPTSPHVAEWREANQGCIYWQSPDCRKITES